MASHQGENHESPAEFLIGSRLTFGQDNVFMDVDENNQIVQGDRS
jgi:hypothetical protein